MRTLVLLRHGQSTWNLSNRFTGWTDVPLTPLGKKEATEAGVLMKNKGLHFDLVFTSLQKRAHQTTDLALRAMGARGLPVVKDWRLNERHYGALQGLNKAEMAAKFGERQVHIWRRSYGVRPPALSSKDPRFISQQKSYAAKGIRRTPRTECLKDTVARVVPLWRSRIAPQLRAGKRVLVSAHGNSLRALVKHLDKVPAREIVELNIPTGAPLVYELDSRLRPVRHYYLGDAKSIAARMAAVKAQGSAKK